MKKLLLSILALVAVVGLAKAETITVNVNDATDITGEHFDEKPKEGTSNGEAEKWQPLESLKLGNFLFEFSTTGKTAPAYYKTMSTTTGGQYTIRVYAGSTVKVTAPAGFTMANVSFKGSNAASGLTLTATPGSMTLSGNNATWTGSANSFSFEVSATWRITEVTFSNDNGGTTPPDQPGDDTDLLTFSKATQFEAGEYAIVAEGKAGKCLTGKTCGYISGTDVTVANDQVKAPAECVFTFTQAQGGYYIQDSENRYLYMKGTYNSYNFADDLGDTEDGALWTVSIAANGEATITNVAKAKVIQWSVQYNSYGAYSEITNVLPVLYKKVSSSVSAVEADNANQPVEIYNLQGVRLSSSDNLPAGVYVRRQGSEVTKILVK